MHDERSQGVGFQAQDYVLYLSRVSCDKRVWSAEIKPEDTRNRQDKYQNTGK